jgi:flagellar basal-body rod protein FlgB
LPVLAKTYQFFFLEGKELKFYNRFLFGIFIAFFSIQINKRDYEMEFLDRVMGIHEPALRVRNKRLEILSRNIANADTPRFKARDIDFKEILGGVKGQEMKATNPKHYPVSIEYRNTGLLYRTPFNASPDMNTVELSVEQAQFGKASTDYQATLQFLEGRISGIKKALRAE